MQKISFPSISPVQPPLIKEHPLNAGSWTQPKRNQEPTSHFTSLSTISMLNANSRTTYSPFTRIVIIHRIH